MDLTPVQIQSIILLAQGHKSYQVAKLVDVSPETISVWKRNTAFLGLIEQYKLEMLESGREALRSNIGDAVDVARNLMHNAKAEGVRLKAAELILRLSGIDNPQHFAWGIRFDHIDNDR